MFSPTNKFSLYLIKPDGTEYGELNCHSLEIYLSGVNEIGYISFKIPEKINNNSGLVKVNPYYTAIKPSFRVRLEIDNGEKGTYIREFKISRPVEKTDGEKTDIMYYAQSREVELSQKSIISFSGVPVDINDSTGITIEPSGAITHNELAASEIIDYRLEGLTIADVAISILSQTDSSWELNYVDPDLRDVYRSDFDIQGTDNLNALRDLQYIYDCIIIFDTVNKKMGYYKLDNIGNDLGWTIEYGKYLKELSKEEKVQDVVTRMRAVGSDGIGIQGKTYTGKNYIENYDYFLGSFSRDSSGNVLSHSEWMSDDLANAILDYQELVDANKTALDSNFVIRDSLIEEKINKEQDIAYLNNSQSVIEEKLSVGHSLTVGKIIMSKDSRIISSVAGIGTVEAFIGGEWSILSYQKTPNGETVGDVTGSSYRYPVNVISGDNYPDFGSSVIYVSKSEYPDGTNFRLTYDTFGLTLIYQTKNIYETRLSDPTVLEDEKIVLNGIIDSLVLDETDRKLEISTATAELLAIQSDLDISNNDIQLIWDLLDINTNFTATEREEWSNFIVEGIYQNTEISDEDLLLSATQDALDDAKMPELNIDISMISILQTEDSKVDWDKVNLYDFVNIRFERLDIDVQARIMEIRYNPETYGMNLLISTTTNYIRNDNHFMERFVDKVSKSTNMVDFSNNDWNGAKTNTTILSELSNNGIDTKKYNIGSANDESVKIDNNGITIEEKFTVDSDYNPVKNTPSSTNDQRYSDRIIRFGNGGIFLSKDGGQTFSVAITPEQIFADVIKGTLLVGDELRILGNDGIGDIVTVGEILTDDFGIKVSGTITGDTSAKVVDVLITRDKGFKIIYDGIDKFFVGTDGVINAKGLKILDDSNATMLENGKIFANYIEGSLTIGTNLTVEGELIVGSDLTITGSDGTNDIISIGEVLTDDFGIIINGIINEKPIITSMTRDKGFNINYDGDDKFFVGLDGILNAKGLNILNSSDETMVEDGKIFANFIEGSLTVGANLTVEGELIVGADLSIIGNDGTNDVIKIGEVLTDNFGIIINGIINDGTNDKTITVSMTRDDGFKITYDSIDKFFVDIDGVINARGLKILNSSDDGIMLEDGKITASYIEGSLTIGSNLSVEGSLTVGDLLSIVGNDGTSDVMNIGNVLTSDFGIIVSGIIDTKNVLISMTRDTGFNIEYDGKDVFGINATGILQAKGIELYTDDTIPVLMADGTKLVADYVQGNLLVGSELLILGNDGTDDIINIGEVLTDDFGLVINGEVDSKPVIVSMTRDDGFNISIDSENVFSAGVDGKLVARDFEIQDGRGKVIMSNNKMLQNITFQINREELLLPGDTYNTGYMLTSANFDEYVSLFLMLSFIVESPTTPSTADVTFNFEVEALNMFGSVIWSTSTSLDVINIATNINRAFVVPTFPNSSDSTPLIRFKITSDAINTNNVTMLSAGINSRIYVSL